MRIKVKYNNRSESGIKNALQHKDFINKYYKSTTQPFPQAELLILENYTYLYYNK